MELNPTPGHQSSRTGSKTLEKSERVHKSGRQVRPSTCPYPQGHLRHCPSMHFTCIDAPGSGQIDPQEPDIEWPDLVKAFPEK